jgi:protein-tyrosine phosphatase
MLSFPFPDHHSPPFATLLKIISSMDAWLKAHSSHVAVVHCLVCIDATEMSKIVAIDQY